MYTKPITPLTLNFIFLATGLLVSSVQAEKRIVRSPDGTIAPEWSCNLLSGRDTCGSDSGDRSSYMPSPVITDINGDDTDDIVVATNNGRCEVLKQQCRQSNGGLYYTSYEEFNAELTLLLNSPDICHQLGQQGHHFTAEQYNWKTIISKYKSLLEI